MHEVGDDPLLKFLWCERHSIISVYVSEVIIEIFTASHVSSLYFLFVYKRPQRVVSNVILIKLLEDMRF